jgi:hypothetical protein
VQAVRGAWESVVYGGMTEEGSCQSSVYQRSFDTKLSGGARPATPPALGGGAQLGTYSEQRLVQRTAECN